MVILSMEDISKTLKDEPLFEGVTFGMERGDKIGLIGPNGTGKSTFLKVVAGLIPPDTGTVAKARELTIGMLEQHPRSVEGRTVGRFLLDSAHPSVRLLRAYHAMLEQKTGFSAEAMHQVMEQIESVHAWDIETRYASFLGELQGPSLDTPMDVLSGGMLKKVAIARVLAPKPDLLLLDEPTNHLDIPTIRWLEDYLVASEISLMLVTHDRYVLDRVCSTIMEFDRGSVYLHPGSYVTFLQRREDRLLGAQAEQERLKTVLRRELVWLQRGPRARTGKDSGRKERIEKMQASLTTEAVMGADFTSMHRRLGKKILELEGIGKSYGGNTVIRPFSHGFQTGERIGIIGPNGSGKTTFLDMLFGRTEPDCGTIDVGVNTAFGYYDQLDTPLDPEKTVLEHIEEIAQEVTLAPGSTISAPRFLEMFGFPVSFHRIKVGLLSGGERRRLHLVGILMQSPNFLLLDEPTNDLDIDTIRRLEEYLLDFQGCALIVSHDRAFLDRVAPTLFVFDNEGRIGKYPGTFSDYADDPPPTASVEQSGPAEGKPEKQRASQRSKKPTLTFNERKELDALMQEIDLLESEIANLEHSFSDPSAPITTLAERTRRYTEKQAILERKIARWEILAAKEQ